MKKNLLLALVFSLLQIPATVNISRCQENQSYLANCSAAVWYTFDKNANDFSGNARHASLGGGAIASTYLSIGANAIDYFNVPISAIQGDVDFTVSCWLKLTTLQHSGSSPCNTWFSGASTSQDNVIAMEYDDADNLIRLTLDNNYYDFSGVTMISGTWYHVLIMRNGTTAKLYFNGTLKGTVTVPNTAINISPNGLIIGQDQDNVGGGFQSEQSLAGMMDNLRIYPCAVDASIISTLFNEGTGTSHINSFVPDFSFYFNPNPASDNINIHFNSNTGIFTIKIYNISGNKVLEKYLPVGYDQVSFDLKGLDNGVYLLRLENPDGLKKQAVFIKR